MEFQCRVIVQRCCTSCCSPVENIPLQAEHHSGRRAKLFAFPPEPCSPSDRNAVRNHTGMVFAFTTESRSPSTGFPNTDKTRLTSVWLLVGISNSGAASIAGNWQLEIESPRIKTVATFSRLPQTTHSPHIQGKFNDEDAIYEKTLQKPIEKGAGVTGWAYFTIPGRVAYEELNNGAAIIHLTCYDYLNKKHTSAAFSPDSKPTTPNYFPGVRGGFHVLDK
jgi:hypothetical protein